MFDKTSKIFSQLYVCISAAPVAEASLASMERCLTMTVFLTPALLNENTLEIFKTYSVRNYGTQSRGCSVYLVATLASQFVLEWFAMALMTTQVLCVRSSDTYIWVSARMGFFWFFQATIIHTSFGTDSTQGSRVKKQAEPPQCGETSSGTLLVASGRRDRTFSRIVSDLIASDLLLSCATAYKISYVCPVGPRKYHALYATYSIKWQIQQAPWSW